MRYFHTATNEWIESRELQRRLDKRFDFKCNECKKSIGSQLGVLAEGIYCPGCRDRIAKVLISEGATPVNLDPFAN